MSVMKRHIEIVTSLTESSPSDYAGIVKIDENKIREVTEGDDDPRYVVSLIEEGESSNNVVYDRPFFENVADQVNRKEPVGYLGHKHFQGQDKEDLLPDPQVVWLGSAVTTNDKGKSLLVTKGYLLPTSEGGKARGWIKRRAINSVSWAGDAVLTFQNGKYHVKEFFLESIDFARKNRAGMKGQRLAVVTEMEGEKRVDGDLTVADVGGKLTFQELNQYNPQLVLAIKEMGKDEVKGETVAAVKAKEEELTTKHQDEIKNHPEISLMEKIREALGVKDDVDADPVAVLSAMIERLDDLSKKLVHNWFTNEILNKKVPNDKARKLVSRLIPVTEMQGDWRSEKGIEKIKQDLENRADDLLENDDDVQTIIKEMASSRGGARFSEGRNRGGESHDDNNNNGNSEFKDIERRGNLSVEKVKVGY